jgi:hypothetical protein
LLLLLLVVQHLAKLCGSTPDAWTLHWQRQRQQPLQLLLWLLRRGLLRLLLLVHAAAVVRRGHQHRPLSPHCHSPGGSSNSSSSRRRRTTKAAEMHHGCLAHSSFLCSKSTNAHCHRLHVL